MNSRLRYVILTGLAIAILLALAATIHSPLLYALEKEEFSSPYHTNVDALKQQSINSTTDILPDLQDLVDFTGPISLNIRIHDAEQAKRDLERFQNSRGSIKNLIVRLDMNESEIQQLEEDTALQKEILDSLLNTSMTLDDLQMLEIQYHSQNNQDMLSTIRLRGEELRKKVRGLDARYRNVTERVAQSGKKLGLNTTKNQESQKEVEQIVQAIEKPRSADILPVDTSLMPGDERISLYIHPETGRYREIIEYQGISLTLLGNKTVRQDSKQIVMFIDDVPTGATDTDTFGYYSLKLPIEQVTAGNHTVYTRSPTTRSPNKVLTVIPVDSKTNLTVSKPGPDGVVNCSGIVMANYPVRSATVQITWDKTHVLFTKTDAMGRFLRQIELPPGQHTLVASFSGTGYPIKPSESSPQFVDVSLVKGIEIDYGHIGLIITALIILILFLGLGIFYLRRMTQKRVPASVPEITDREEEETFRIPLDGEIAGMDPISSDTGLLRQDDETLISYYTRLLDQYGLTSASWKIYQLLASHVARDLNIRRHRTLTAREISRNCKGKPYCGPFTRFIAVYERIRYGGVVSVKDQAIFETALNSTEEQMGGDRH